MKTTTADAHAVDELVPRPISSGLTGEPTKTASMMTPSSSAAQTNRSISPAAMRDPTPASV